MTSHQHWTETQRRQQICELLRNKGVICRTYLLTGNCPRSPMCPYMHIRNGEVRMLPWSVCNFFNNGVCLRENCSYFHGSQEQLDKLRASGVKVYKPQDYMKIASPPMDFLDESSDLLHSSASQNSEASVQQPPELLSVESLPLTLPLHIRYNEATATTTTTTLTKEQINSLQESPLVNLELSIPPHQRQQQQHQQNSCFNSPFLQHVVRNSTQTKIIPTTATLANVIPVNANCGDRTFYLPQNNPCNTNRHNTILWSANSNCSTTNNENNYNCNNVNNQGNWQSQLVLSNSLLSPSNLEKVNNTNNVAIMQSNLTSNNQINTIPVACQISPSLQPSRPNVQPVQYHYLQSYNALQTNSEPTPANSTPTFTFLTNISQPNPLTLPVISTPTQFISQEINQSSCQQPILEQQKIIVTQEQFQEFTRQQQQSQEQEWVQLLQQHQQQQQQQQQQYHEQRQTQSPPKFQVLLLTSNQTAESNTL